jgi:CheY-like chemotaxis protein
MIPSANEKVESGRKTRRVLYVDDMRELRDVARLALSRSGHTVNCATNGFEAFEMVSADPAGYDIVITDHHMGGMTGLELVMKLREIKFPGMIAIVSSEINTEVAADYHRLGVERILYKPVELGDLRALVLES